MFPRTIQEFFAAAVLHAGLALDGRDRKRVERVCRYLGRPPISQERLTELADGRLRYTMKKPWSDGAHCLLTIRVAHLKRCSIEKLTNRA